MLAPRRFLLCAEDSLSALLARDLCDRVLRERAAHEWLRALCEPAMIEAQRVWVGLNGHAWWADRMALDRAVEAHGLDIAVRDPVTGRRVAPHGKALMAFKAARVAEVLEDIALAVVAADTDGIRDEKQSFAHGLALREPRIAVLCAAIERESEAWVISGFVARNNAERDDLRAITEALGFDPTLHSERLMSDRAHDVRDAKRVARALFERSGGAIARNERFCACWQETDLDTLIARGQHNGMSRFIADILRIVVPVLSAR
ncbi:MAG: hypothetical protein Q8Q09_21360 [Deltaproteobacteria bacterium]|nr:hypothetical protein [Deltaproteobacteria bacterium]